jgi:ligand-binding sensor domain-containing protein
MISRWTSTSTARRISWWLGAALLLLTTTPAHAGLNQWTSNGPEGGPLLSLAVDRVAPANVYAGTNGAGVFKSPNGGTSWAAVNGGLDNRVVNALVVDPSASGVVYAATNAGVFKTTTGGTTWVASSTGLPLVPPDNETPRPILSLAIDPSTPSILYAGTANAGVWKSGDGGASWTAVNNGFQTAFAVNALTVDRHATNIVYAGTATGGVYKSDNAGGSWSPFSVLLGSLNVFALAVQSDSTLYAGTAGGVWRTSSNGFWIQTGLTGVTVNDLVIDSSATFYAGTATAGVFKSTNGFAWEPASTGLPDQAVAALAVDPQNAAIVYAATATGAAKTSNAAQSWVSVNTGLVLSQVTAAAIDPQTPATVYAGTQGIGVFKSADGGTSWAPSNNGLGNLFVNALAIGAAAPGTIYAATNGGGVFKTVDAGGTWAAANTGLTNANVTALAVHPTAATVLYAGTNSGVFKTTNGAGAWVPATTGITSGAQIRGFAIDPSAPETVYAATSVGIFKSSDGGGAWTAMNNGLGTATSIRTIAVDPQSPARLYAGTTSGVFQSDNAGASWTPTGEGITETSIRVIVVDPQAPATVYTATSGGGVFRSTNQGGTWTSFNPGLANDDVRALAISPSGACLHAGTFGGGVFDLATRFEDPCAALSPPVSAAVLPSARSVAVNTPATAFATILNPNPTDAKSCGISLLTDEDATFAYQTTDPNTNQAVGTPNTPVDIPAGGSQTYVIGITPTDNFNDVELQFGFTCAGVAPAPLTPGVNTLLLSAFEGAPRPDIVALSTAVGGIVTIPGPTGTGFLVVASINLGGDGTITASADTGGVPLPIVPLICRTDPVTSICIDPPAPTVRLGFPPNATPTFAVFVIGIGGHVPFDPAVNRVFVRFKSGSPGSEVTRGATSVAVRTQ